MNLDGAVVVVTGASRGIGAATADAAARRGASVGLIARDRADLEAVASRLARPGITAVADVTRRADVDDAIARVTESLGPIDVLINNAGAGSYAAVLEEAPERFEQLMALNYLGTVHTTLAVLPIMANRRHGHIVNVASVAGRLGAPFEAAYSASKFAVVGFTESLAAEMAAFDVTCSLVEPGPVDTSFAQSRGVPFQRRYPRPLRPELVADAIMAAIEHNRFEQVLPRWLRIGILTRSVAPTLYRRGLVNTAAREAHRLLERSRSE